MCTRYDAWMPEGGGQICFVYGVEYTAGQTKDQKKRWRRLHTLSTRISFILYDTVGLFTWIFNLPEGLSICFQWYHNRELVNTKRISLTFGYVVSTAKTVSELLQNAYEVISLVEIRFLKK